MDDTDRFALPLLSPGQAQKELFHNEALHRIDALLCPIVEGAPSATPPADPTAGSCYLVGTNASGAWQGSDGWIASFTNGGWRFIAPIEAMQLIDRASGQPVARRGTTWETGVIRAREVWIDGERVVAARQPAIPSPAGGATVDAECRSAVAAVLEALRNHGLIA
jgi:hypothetical protein